MKITNWKIKLATIFSLIIIWHILSSILDTSLFPNPFSVFLSFLDMIKEETLLKDILWSLRRIIISLIFAIFFGVVLGMITSKLSLAYQSIGTILDYIKSISPIALVPFIILWFGIGESAKILTIVYLITTVIWLNTDTGIRNVNKLYLWTAKSLGADNYDLVRHIIIPQALPFIVTGIRTAIAWAFIIIVAAEMNGASFGLGYHIYQYYQNFFIDKMLVNLIVLTSIAYSADKLFLFIIKRQYGWYFTENAKNY